MAYLQDITGSAGAAPLDRHSRQGELDDPGLGGS